MLKRLAATVCLVSVISGSSAFANLLENGTPRMSKPAILLAGDASCENVIRFVCRWEDGVKFCERAVTFVCD